MPPRLTDTNGFRMLPSIPHILLFSRADNTVPAFLKVAFGPTEFPESIP
jgi:hypothetical protein